MKATVSCVLGPEQDAKSETKGLEEEPSAYSNAFEMNPEFPEPPVKAFSISLHQSGPLSLISSLTVP